MRTHWLLLLRAVWVARHAMPMMSSASSAETYRPVPVAVVYTMPVISASRWANSAVQACQSPQTPKNRPSAPQVRQANILLQRGSRGRGGRGVGAGEGCR